MTRRYWTYSDTFEQFPTGRHVGDDEGAAFGAEFYYVKKVRTGEVNGGGRTYALPSFAKRCLVGKSSSCWRMGEVLLRRMRLLLGVGRFPPVDIRAVRRIFFLDNSGGVGSVAGARDNSGGVGSAVGASSGDDGGWGSRLLMGVRGQEWTVGRHMHDQKGKLPQSRRAIDDQSGIEAMRK